jgi:hypothetical protein
LLQDLCPRFAALAARNAADRKLGISGVSVVVELALAAVRHRQAHHQENNEAAEFSAHAVLLRDVVGSPFSPVALSPSWLTPTVVALADAIYSERAFDRMPVLADALEKAGYDHPDVPGHCRGDGPRVRGCWVVDLVLGKGYDLPPCIRRVGRVGSGAAPPRTIRESAPPSAPHK